MASDQRPVQFTHAAAVRIARQVHIAERAPFGEPAIPSRGPRDEVIQGCISVRSTSLPHGAEAEWVLIYATNTNVLALAIDDGGRHVIAIKVAGVYHVDLALNGWVRIGLGGVLGSNESIGFGIEDTAHDSVDGGSFGQRYVEKQSNPYGNERIEIDGSKSFDFLVAGTDEWHVHIYNAGAGLGQIQWNMHLVQEYVAPLP